MFSDIHRGGSGKPFPGEGTPAPGDKIDARIQCAICGFPVWEDAAASGDTQDSPGLSLEETAVPISNTDKNLPQPLQGLSVFLAASRNVKTNVVQSGCPQCGTLNWRGEQSTEFDEFRGSMEGR